MWPQTQIPLPLPPECSVTLFGPFLLFCLSQDLDLYIPLPPHPTSRASLPPWIFETGSLCVALAVLDQTGLKLRVTYLSSVGIKSLGHHCPARMYPLKFSVKWLALSKGAVLSLCHVKQGPLDFHSNSPRGSSSCGNQASNDCFLVCSHLRSFLA